MHTVETIVIVALNVAFLLFLLSPKHKKAWWVSLMDGVAMLLFLFCLVAILIAGVCKLTE